MADDLCLLFDTIALKRLPRSKHISIATKWMASQRQVIFPVNLRLPDMGHLVHKQPLLVERGMREIIAVI